MVNAGYAKNPGTIFNIVLQLVRPTVCDMRLIFDGGVVFLGER